MNKRYFELLAKQFPDAKSIVTEIMNLHRILSLPKGTEYFMSDIHGEYEKFGYILNNCSGVIQDTIEDIFKELSLQEQTELCLLIYIPQETLSTIQQNQIDQFCQVNLLRLVQLARYLSAKYTRSRVRKYFPKEYAYILDELLSGFQTEEMIKTLIHIDKCCSFLIAMCDLIKRLAVSHLHILGDLYDRGARGDKVVDMLQTYHSVDIQWGNHDILIIGAAAGNLCCIAMVVLNAFKYKHLEMLENGYGICLRHVFNNSQVLYPELSDMEACYKTMAILMFKLEGQLIIEYPEYQLDDKLYLDKIKGNQLYLNHHSYPLKDSYFPTIDSNNPYHLCETEKIIIENLQESFMESQKLHNHVQFLLERGSVYHISNNILLYHGCIPLDFCGRFITVEFNHQKYQGKAYLDFIDRMIRKGYHQREKYAVDFYWYLWCGRLSPLCGRNLKQFIRMFVDDGKLGIEESNAYYMHLDNEDICDMILKEFSIKKGHIVNGHTPVKIKEGQSPIKAQGKMLIIDGGFSPQYYHETGNSGYTLISDSTSLRLRSHCHEISWQTTLKDQIIESYSPSLYIKDCDTGHILEQQIKDLLYLLEAYRQGEKKA